MPEPSSLLSYTKEAIASESDGFTCVLDPLLSLHEVEQAVWRELHSLEGVHFPRLVVRRVHDGICLQGILETENLDSVPDIAELVRKIGHVDHVVNQLLVRDAVCPSRRPR